MDLITFLTKKTLNIFNINTSRINEVLNKNHYTIIDNLIKEKRKKEIQSTAEHVFQLVENGITLACSEILKYSIVMFIAYCLCLGISLPTFIIMTIFTVLRVYAGGVHLSTFNKCFGAMIVCFLSLGWIVTKIHINLESIILGYIICIYLSYKYAPQERQDKSDKDCDNGNVKKYKTMLFVTVCGILSMVLVGSYQLISLSIFFGVLLEIFTITPIGTKLFKWIDGKIYD